MIDAQGLNCLGFDVKYKRRVYYISENGNAIYKM